MEKMKHMGCILLLLLLVSFAGCSKNDGPEYTEEERLVQKACRFVYDYTSEAYLWNEFIPAGITHNSAPTPEELFELMRYKALDRWSYVTDNSREAMEEFQGVSTTYGYSLAFGRFSNMPENMFAVVQFVYDDSPASKSGLKRGDIILGMNGSRLTEENYMQLYYSQSVEIAMGVIRADGTIAESDVSHKLTAVKMYEDPVVAHYVLDAGGKRVGYLSYAGFYAESHQKLVEVFKEFQAAGVSELILDLRYNLGGNADTPPYLASLFAPTEAVKGKGIFLTQVWNDLYMNYYRQKKYDLNVYFEETIPVNLNLERVFVLTTGSTASASEATISGLMPYMEVIGIGTPTYGKYCGAALLVPTDKDGKEDEEINNWLLSLVVYKFVNSQGYTEFKDGITPRYNVADDGLLMGIPLGDTSDPMIAKALSIIAGTQSKAESAGQFMISGAYMEPAMGVRRLKGGMNLLMDMNRYKTE